MQKDGHVFHTAADDAALEELINKLTVAELWQSVFWNELEAAWEAKEHSTAAISGYAEDRYYEKRAIEETFRDFLRIRPERGMIIVGESGMGKRTPLVHLALVCRRRSIHTECSMAANLFQVGHLNLNWWTGQDSKICESRSYPRIILADHRCGRRKNWKALARFYRRHQ